ncbi:hypothetical protein AB4Y36_38220 [Paraburkholderia sp. BR10936]|uniref:hypothetical protein n=1 Tax=Paraburkholderia sp. BR10936 TaxID=3236993 RepID=UPI0034D28333
MSARELAFDAAAHRYSVGGHPLPAVSRVLHPVSPYADRSIPRDVLARKAEIGAAAHRAIELDIRGVLDTASLHPLIEPYFAAWRRFCAEAHYTAAASEIRVWHPALRYAGTLDSLGWLGDSAALVDFKCTAAIMPTVGPQTAAYQEAASTTPDIDPALCQLARQARRWCLQLCPDGTYRMVPLDDPNDLRVFLALLTIHTFRQHHADHYPEQ